MDAWEDVPHMRVQEVAELLPHVDVLTLHLPLNKDLMTLSCGQAMRFLVSLFKGK
jgi:phosphoglycerate dehydrogenase-like enzyme